MDELKIKLSEKDINNKINIEYPDYRLYVDKSELGVNDNEKKNYNLFAIARKNLHVKNLVVDLSNKGYYLVEHKNGVSTFEKFITSESFKANLTYENLKTFGEHFYTIEEPNIITGTRRLLVVFSSVADYPFNASIGRRNFFKNFPTIGKYLPPNTYVLRISDIGGVVGSFYLNNIFNKNIENNIQNLIKFVLRDKNILYTNTVFYGVSKGATGALYHSILGKYKSVSVDPIVSDEYHEEKYNDTHFTIGTFPETKQKKFMDFIQNTQIPKNINIIYSKNSPIFSYINTIIKNNDSEKKINYINVCHSKIKDHPDVGPYTINVLTMVLNNLFYEAFEIKSMSIDC